MANVLTNLAADLYTAADRVSRELVGFIPACTLNSSPVERLAKNGLITSHATRAVSAGNRNEAIAISEGTDQTVDNKPFTITKDRSVEIPYTGEDVKFLNSGSGFQTVMGDQIAQAMRTLTNEMETDLAVEAYQNASRAQDIFGSAPFDTANDFRDASFTRKILVDNGAGEVDLSLIINTTAGANLRGKQSSAASKNDDLFQHNGILLPYGGMMVRESDKVQSHTKGTGTGYLTNSGTTNAVGDTVIPADTGSGTIVAGDIVSFAADTANKYVVVSALSGGSFTIGAPGLKVAIPDGNAITVHANYEANVGFRRSALELGVRLPARPLVNGQPRDAAIDRMVIQDPYSGLVYEASVYVGQGKMMLEIAAAWGVKAWKEEHIALLAV